MNILAIAWRQIRATLRDRTAFVFMLAFPIVLMLILGTALSNAFSSGIEMDTVSLTYSRTAQNPGLLKAWDQFENQLRKQKVKLTAAADPEQARKAVQEGRYSAYAEIGDKGIRFYGENSIESTVAQGMLTVFADKYNLAAAVMKNKPERAEAILAGAGGEASFIRETSIASDKKPDSLDYYAMAMSTMTAFYACMSASNLLSGERSRRTSIRLMAAPVSRAEIFTGKVLGNTLINCIFVLTVFAISKWGFGADWGQRTGMVLGVLFTEVLLAVSIGLGCSFLFKDNTGTTVALILTQFISFFGGAYFPLGQMGGWMNIVSGLSPLRWANQALTGLIYEHSASEAVQAMGLNIGIALLLLLLAAGSLQRREEL
ncbi:ABC transporter permease [Paenibacillus spiritus]|uniref:ABC transporter permease n=1 Tax=Paenibacillus spiritus TaxID=2496557 RepID=A0A5J5GLG0_9BACL|nr:ABC transporter permease [Paenibacillus spiritus]KAA9008453.1 ABC transporter permease [Paenibacillus spiritus]